MPGNKSVDISNLSIDGLTPDMLMSEPAEGMHTGTPKPGCLLI